MHKLKWLLLALPGLALLMAPTGGIPSNPQFQSVRASGASSAINCPLPAPGVLCGNSTSASAWGSVVGSTAGASALGLEVQAGTGAATAHILRLQNAAGTTTYLDALGTGATSLTMPFAGTARPLLLVNTTAGTTSATQLSIQNELLSATHELDLGYTASGFSGAFLTGGNTGESAYINTPGAVSVCLGSNNICKVNAIGNAGVSVMPGGGFGLQVGAPTGGDKGTGTANATAIYQGGVQVPKIASATLQTPATCVLANAVNLAGCVRSSAGAYTFTMSAGFTATPVCTVSPLSTGILLAPPVANASSTTAGSMAVVNASGTATDAQLNVICTGI